MNYAWAAPIQSSSVAVNTNAWDAILSASPVVQLTLLILVGLSIFCWAVGLAKYAQLRQLAQANEPFINRFWKASSLESLNEDLDQYLKKSSVARVFRAGYMELQKLADQRGGNGPLQLSGSDNLERALRKAIDLEISAMESRLTLLATTGSTGPFIGLFGTVWGIMGSFHKIGASGSASLAVVAPGISEALIATAIGLAAAIPAVVLYNNFVAQIRRQEIDLNNFANDFLNISKRNFFKE
ncbi:MAG: protein TolQ [Bdellovibrionaceae bacterium]|nr:protein TolQ [Pseudobdellovibrionaceae bacterium]